MTYDGLPHVDEHDVVVDVSPARLWDAAFRTLTGSLSGAPVQLVARLLGCRTVDVRPAPEVVGTTLAGFEVTAADRPRLLVLEGRHRFSRYAIVVHVDGLGDAARCRLESRAAFPGVHGRLYRLAVIGSGAHVVAVRRLLAAVAADARRSGAPTSG